MHVNIRGKICNVHAAACDTKQHQSIVPSFGGDSTREIWIPNENDGYQWRVEFGNANESCCFPSCPFNPGRTTTPKTSANRCPKESTSPQPAGCTCHLICAHHLWTIAILFPFVSFRLHWILVQWLLFPGWQEVTRNTNATIAVTSLPR